MAGRQHIGSRWSPGVWALVALAVALRLTVLPGYMTQAAPGAMTVVLCTAQGAVIQTVGGDGAVSSPDDQKDERSDKSPVCAFSMAGVALPALDVRIVAAAPPVAGPTLPSSTTSTAPGRGLAAPPPPSTGPPFIA